MGVSSRLENALPTSVHTQHSCYFRTEFPSESESEVAQLCLSLPNPLDCSLPGSSIHGIFKARVLEWGAIAFSVIYMRFVQTFFALTVLQ